MLLHGLGRTSRSMRSLQRSLENNGFCVRSQSYPSTKRSVEELSHVVGKAIEQCAIKNAFPIHFVTHSLGGILIRHYFQNHGFQDVGRVVMLGPPNHGSEIVDRCRNKWWFKLATGPSGQELGTEPTSIPNSLKHINLEVGIIAGRKSSDPWFSPFFTGQNDGKVSVASARLEGMKDFLVVDRGHTFMVNSKEVCRQTVAFLRTGKFEKT